MADVAMESITKDQFEDETHVNGEGEEDELFGSVSDGEAVASSPKRRRLDDKELDSGDEEGRADRVEEDEDQQVEGEYRERNVIDAPIGRHGVPNPTDGELHLLSFPASMGIDPKTYDPTQFQPPATEHHTSEQPPETFSAYQTSLNTLRWRYSPKDPSQIQSNARILKWSDGSLTLQLASNPKEQFPLSSKPLAPPKAPLGTSTSAGNRGRNGPSAHGYDSRLDTHTYLCAPHESVGLVRITNKLTSALTVELASNENDEALLRLRESLAAATRSGGANSIDEKMTIKISEDPELAKKKAEVAEKEKARAQKRREVQAERERDRANRVLGRSGLRTGGYGAGLTVGGLEDDEDMGSGRPRAAPRPKKKPRRSRYSDDEEDDYRRGHNREDEYDEDDPFLVGSDEEPELDGDNDEDDDIDRVDAEAEKQSKAAAAGEGGRLKRRVVVDEDDEDD